MSASEDEIRVLHVDDDPSQLDLAARVLERENERFVVETAIGVEEGLARLRDGAVDCVVSDYDMPGRDGLEFLATVRETHPQLPFILFTGKGSEEVASEAISAGVTDYLQKRGTEQYSLLANRITNAVGKRRAEAEADLWMQALEAANEGIAIVDGDGRYVRMNDAYAELCGAEPGELVGEPWTVTVPPAEVERLQQEVFPTLPVREGWAEESVGRRLDGEVYPKLLSLASLDDGGHVCVIRDISEQKAREEELREANARLRALFDRSPDMIDVHDEDGVLLDVNQRLCELLGYTEEELVGKHVWEIDQSIDPAEVRALWERMDYGDVESIDAEYRRRDGTTFPAEVHLVKVDLDGETRFFVISRDVTERHRQREALEDRERVLREMYEIIADRQQPFTEQVEALLALGRAELGVAYGTLSEVRGDDYVFEVVDADGDDIQAGDVVPLSATNCEIAASDEETLVLGDVARDAPGETDRAGYAEWGISCYIGAPVYVDDEVRGTVCFYDTDPREGQFSEWEVTLVDLMSRWVSYELQRRRTTERLQRQNETLEQFASVVSHDLRNPLNVLSGRLELAEETGDPAEFEHCRRAIERMETLIDDMLSLARAGERIDETATVDLGSLAEECWQNVVTTEATLRVESERTVRADPTRLRQLLENLFRNAVEHGARRASGRSAPEDAVEHGSTSSRPEADDAVEHGARRASGRSAPEDAVEHGSPGPRSQPHESAVEHGAEGVVVTVGDLPDGFFVADDGPGIPEEECEAVFDSGYSTAGGTGFGLAIVAEITEAHGWSVSVTESESGGARFEFTDVDRGEA